MQDPMAYFYELYDMLPRGGPGDGASTARAYSMMKDLPAKPLILDIGCGPGMQTMELARLSKGHVIAIDNHQPFLDKLIRDAKAAALSKFIEAKNISMLEMPFPPASFDVIWSEGALYLMGFEAGLKKCRELIKPKGYIAVTELVWLTPERPKEITDYLTKEYPAIKTVEENLKLIGSTGLEIVGHFTLPSSSWLDEYYAPMKKPIEELKMKYKDNSDALAVLNSSLLEAQMYRKYSDHFGYEFFVSTGP